MENENMWKFWSYVLSVSDSMSDAAKASTADHPVGKKDLLEYLGTIEESFGGSMDPTDNFKEYVVLHLCRSVQRVLESIESESTK